MQIKHSLKRTMEVTSSVLRKMRFSHNYILQFTLIRVNFKQEESMSINIIVALNETHSIGKNGQLLYRIKKDLDRFRELTTKNNGHPNICLMGKRTFEELPKPLNKRFNVVLTTNKKYNAPKEVIIESSFDKVINHYLESGDQDKDLWICGGKSLYEKALPFADKVYITYIHDNKKGDTYFPYQQVKQQFKKVHSEQHEEDGLKFEFINYERKDNADGENEKF